MDIDVLIHYFVLHAGRDDRQKGPYITKDVGKRTVWRQNRPQFHRRACDKWHCSAFGGRFAHDVNMLIPLKLAPARAFNSTSSS